MLILQFTRRASFTTGFFCQGTQTREGKQDLAANPAGIIENRRICKMKANRSMSAAIVLECPVIFIGYIVFTTKILVFKLSIILFYLCLHLCSCGFLLRYCFPKGHKCYFKSPSAKNEVLFWTSRVGHRLHLDSASLRKPPINIPPQYLLPNWFGPYMNCTISVLPTIVNPIVRGMFQIACFSKQLSWEATNSVNCCRDSHPSVTSGACVVYFPAFRPFWVRVGHNKWKLAQRNAMNNVV